MRYMQISIQEGNTGFSAVAYKAEAPCEHHYFTRTKDLFNWLHAMLHGRDNPFPNEAESKTRCLDRLMSDVSKLEKE